MRDDSLVRIYTDAATSKTIATYIGGGDYGPPGAAGLVFKWLKPQQAATLVSIWCKMCGNGSITREAFAVSYPKKQMYISQAARGERTDQEVEVKQLMATIDEAIAGLPDWLTEPPQPCGAQQRRGTQKRSNFGGSSSSTPRVGQDRNVRQRL
jgi:hypothetical protein